MGIYDSLRNQTVSISVKGNVERARSHVGRVKKIIEKIQGGLDLGVNEGMLKTQRVALDDATIMDVSVTPGVTTPIIRATITAGVSEAREGIEEISEILLSSCPSLPQGRPGARLFTQLMGDTQDVTEEKKSFQLLPWSNYTWYTRTFFTDPYAGWWNPVWVDMGDYPITYRGQTYDRLGLGYQNGSIQFDQGDGWADISTNHETGACTGYFGNNFDQCTGGGGAESPVPFYCDLNNYISYGGGAGFQGGFGLTPSVFDPISESELPFIGVRVGEAFEATDYEDSDGNKIMRSYRGSVWTTPGYYYTRFNTRLQADVTYIGPDHQMVFLDRDPVLGCPKAMGIFINGSDGEQYYLPKQGDYSDGRLGTFEGRNGWCDTFGTFTNTADVYDRNWFCQNVVRLCVIVLNNVGIFPGLTNWRFVTTGNRSYITADPYGDGSGGDAGYATAPYCSRCFWFEQDGAGYINSIILQDWSDGRKAQESDVWIDNWES